ncbi:MAG TPA: TspO/MBR family protein [Polyangia bacterium]|nr:TspO/MBR family protein [Polyangia bacterium]
MVRTGDSSKGRSLLWLALFAGATAVAAGLGAGATRRGRGVWYRALSKPAGQPPPAVFGPVWTTLYGLMSVSAYRVFRARRSPQRRRALGLWWTQLALNGAWSPLFFGAHRARLALADLVALSLAASKYTHTAAKVDRPAAWLMAPYLGWLGYAGWLNLGIVRKNPRLAG